MRISLLSIVCLLVFIASASSQVGIGTNSPNPSAQLDVTSTNRGFLPPRVALTATNATAPVANPVVGLLVYNTATSGGTPLNVSPGYYYWNGTRWQPVVNRGNAPGDMQYWDGTRWINIPLGLNGQNLTICNGIPVWGTCANTLVISPTKNVYEGTISSNSPGSVLIQYEEAFLTGWTVGGAVSNTRFLIKFDQTSMPANAVVDSAKLYLYADSTPIAGNMVDAHFGSSNAFYVQRISSAFTAASAYSWNDQPTSVTTNQVLVPQSTSAFQNEIIDVTELVKDMQAEGNNGFLLRLQNETFYNSRQYVSSFDPDAKKHPRLVISYH